MLKIVAPILCRSVSSAVLIAALSGCVLAPPPYEEYTLARSAVQAARDAESAQYSVGLWSKADDNYRRGQRAWNDNEFGSAKKYFKVAIDYAERAENASRLKKFRTGGNFP